MGKTVIEVNNISKRYRIGLKEEVDTFAEQVKNTLLYPIRNFKKITSLNTFKGEDDQSIFWALQNINFKVEQGEVLGIIGKNGAGKSTLLKILSKITEPTTGTIKLKGRVSALLEVGTGFHPELTGRDNIYMNGTILGMTRKEINQKLDEIIAFSGIEKHIDTPVKFYSSGMKVRLGFSVAAHLEPEILIIDEVLAVGDFEFQKKCLGKMDDVAKSGRTVLFVSHDMAAIQNLCSRVIVLNKGKVQLTGTTNDAISFYLNQKLLNRGQTKNYDRKGTGELIIEEINVTNDLQRMSRNSVELGRDVYFIISIKMINKIKGSYFSIALSISDIFGGTITTLHTKFINKVYTFPKDSNKIICKVANFPLAQGVYNISSRILEGKEGKDAGGVVIDHVNDFCSFEVISGDFFNTGRNINPEIHGKLILNQMWF